MLYPVAEALSLLANHDRAVALTNRPARKLRARRSRAPAPLMTSLGRQLRAALSRQAGCACRAMCIGYSSQHQRKPFFLKERLYSLT
jgi:hypothetical protein